MREHGTRAKYVIEKCRCEPCTTANRLYARERDRHLRRVAYGIENPSTKYVDAGETRAHIDWLSSIGVGRRTIAQITGLRPKTIRDIRIGDTRRVLQSTANRILAIGRSAQPATTHIDAAPTWTLINDLLYLGFTKTRIAHELGAKTPALQINPTRVTLENARRVEAVYEQLLRETAPWHGDLAGYKKNNCRCLRCTAASREYMTLRRQLRKEFELTEGGR